MVLLTLYEGLLMIAQLALDVGTRDTQITPGTASFHSYAATIMKKMGNGLVRRA